MIDSEVLYSKSFAVDELTDDRAACIHIANQCRVWLWDCGRCDYKAMAGTGDDELGQVSSWSSMLAIASPERDAD